jgi:SAM-dependent methyltransferase
VRLSKAFKSADGQDLQFHNASWWRQHPMNYDWHGTIRSTEGTVEFFDEIDRRHFSSSSFHCDQRPFDRLIPFGLWRGKRVLEIGCGLGSHTQLLSEAGCNLTAIDITDRAVDLTRKRLALKSLNIDVRQMDAEQMDFPDEEFDSIWSWGVIHHSANTEEILSQVARVLKPGGEFRFMVYNRRSLHAQLDLARGLLSGKVFRGMSPSEILDFYCDGYVARHFTTSELSELLVRFGLVPKEVRLMGQKSELLPLPGRGAIGQLKYSFLNRIPDSLAETALSRVGWFLFAVATKPLVGTT